MAIRILGVAPTVSEKGGAQKVGETGASHLTDARPLPPKDRNFPDKM